MGWRFRTSVKVFPGVRLNVSSRGVSTTVGGRYARVTFSDRGTYAGVSIPGTGLSYRERLDQPHSAPAPHRVPAANPAPPSLFDVVPEHTSATSTSPTPLPGEIASGDVAEMTSPGLGELKRLLTEAHAERRVLTDEVATAAAAAVAAERRHRLWRRAILVNLLFKGRVERARARAEETEARRAELQAQLGLCTVSVDMQFEAQFPAAFERLSRAYDDLARCRAIWDKTSAVAINPFVTRAAAGTEVTRERVQFSRGDTPLITVASQALHLTNANGGDIFIYPGFVLVLHDAARFALVAYQDVTMTYKDVRFVEDGLAVESEQGILINEMG